MLKRERGNEAWILAAACLLRDDIPGLPTDLRRSHRAKLISRDLHAALARASRPTRAEIEADKYEECVPVRQWLGSASRKCN